MDLATVSEPAWIAEPQRQSVREWVETEGGRTFRLAFLGSSLHELTELTNGEERLIHPSDPAWRRWAGEVAVGAFEDGED
jgi:hypothetical protein